MSSREYIRIPHINTLMHVFLNRLCFVSLPTRPAPCAYMNCGYPQHRHFRGSGDGYMGRAGSCAATPSNSEAPTMENTSAVGRIGR